MTKESKTQILELFGTLEWAKVFEHNRDRATWNEDKDGEYKVTISMDKDNADKLRASGCAKKMNDLEDGGVKVTLARPHKGRHDWQSGPPAVANIKGQPWDFEMDGYIGNGSTGLVRVAVYPTGTGRTGTRLEAVQVVDHVEYESEGGGSTGGFRDLSNVSSQSAKPKEEPKKKVASKKSPVEDDAIPF